MSLSLMGTSINSHKTCLCAHATVECHSAYGELALRCLPRARDELSRYNQVSSSVEAKYFPHEMSLSPIKKLLCKELRNWPDLVKDNFFLLVNFNGSKNKNRGRLTYDFLRNSIMRDVSKIFLFRLLYLNT